MAKAKKQRNDWRQRHADAVGRIGWLEDEVEGLKEKLQEAREQLEVKEESIKVVNDSLTSMGQTLRYREQSIKDQQTHISNLDWEASKLLADRQALRRVLRMEMGGDSNG